jgi:hypothetical protein
MDKWQCLHRPKKEALPLTRYWQNWGRSAKFEHWYSNQHLCKIEHLFLECPNFANTQTVRAKSLRAFALTQRRLHRSSARPSGLRLSAVLHHSKKSFRFAQIFCNVAKPPLRKLPLFTDRLL